MSAEEEEAPGFPFEEAPEPLLYWRDLLPWAPLTVAFVLALVIYWPSFDSAFFGDDYQYVQAVKTLSFGHYLRVSLDPGAHDETLTLAQDYWRPLFFLSFQVTYRFFGAHVLAYHLLNFAVHLASIVLVWLLARRMTRRGEAAAVACVLFAVHPAGVESIAWISSFNSTALPLGLAAWLAFISAVESEDPAERRRRHVLALLLLALALGFRETAGVFFGAIGAWYVLVPARSRLLDWRTFLPLVPYAALAVLYVVIHTKFFTQPAHNEFAYNWGEQVPEQFWYYLRVGFGSFSESHTVRHRLMANAAAVVLVSAIPAALFARRWVLVVLLVAFVGSVVPNSATTFGAFPRYFYLPSAFFALAMGALTVEVLDLAGRLRKRALGRALVVIAMACAAGFGVKTGQQGVNRWIDASPGVSESWVGQLRSRVDTIPPGGTLYAVNTPMILGLFGGYALKPTVAYYYPGVARVVPVEVADYLKVKAGTGPGDRVFIYEPPP